MRTDFLFCAFASLRLCVNDRISKMIGAPRLLSATFACALVAMACGSARPPLGGPPSSERDPEAPAHLSRDDVRQDVQALERALELGFGPRVFITRDTMRTLHQ